EAVELGEVLLAVGPSFVVSVRHGTASPLAEVRHEVERRPELLALGPGVVLWAVRDRIVDDYAPVVQCLEHEVDAVETEVFSDSGANPAERIYFLKREAIEFLRGCQPLLAPVADLARGRIEALPKEVRTYLRDV